MLLRLISIQAVLRRMLGYVVIFLVSSLSFAEPVDKASDLSVQALFSAIEGLNYHERIIYEQSPVSRDYKLILSGLKKINGFWVSENEKRVKGSVASYTLEIRRDHTLETLEEFWSDLMRKLDGLDAELLFQCTGLDCGSSNAWANNIFKVRQLYGLDQKQRYAVWQRKNSVDNKVQFMTAYLIQRGNRRSYVHFDIVASGERQTYIPSEEVITNRLINKGFIVVANYDVMSDKPVYEAKMIERVASALRSLQGISFYVVGHDRSLDVKDDVREERAKSMSQQFVNMLKDEGIDASKLEVKGVGGWSPEGKSGVLNVVLVVKR